MIDKQFIVVFFDLFKLIAGEQLREVHEHKMNNILIVEEDTTYAIVVKYDKDTWVKAAKLPKSLSAIFNTPTHSHQLIQITCPKRIDEIRDCVGYVLRGGYGRCSFSCRAR